MEKILSILYFVIGLSILIILHELGHYLVSKLFKLEVEEFGLGFPPRLVRLFRIKETEFTLNMIPFGAFVRPKGENDPTIPGGMAAAKPWVRFFVLLGGPFMNILTGILIYSFIFSQTGVPDVTRTLIADVAKNSPAESAGILAGDEILQVNSVPIKSITDLQNAIKTNLGKEITITLIRENTTVTVQAVPRVNPPENEGALGIGIGNPISKSSWFATIPYAFQAAWEDVSATLSVPGKLIRGEIQPSEARMVGPIGMYSIYEQVRQVDAQNSTDFQVPLNTLHLMALVAVALGFTNLLPFPALDGGRIAFLIPEIILRRRPSAKWENIVNAAGFLILIILMVAITANDLINPIPPINP